MVSASLRIVICIYIIIPLLGCGQNENIGYTIFALTDTSTDGDIINENDPLDEDTLIDCNLSKLGVTNPEDFDRDVWDQFDDALFCAPFEWDKILQVISISPHTMCCYSWDYIDCEEGNYSCYVNSAGTIDHDIIEKEVCDLTNVDWIENIYLFLYH